MSPPGESQRKGGEGRQGRKSLGARRSDEGCPEGHWLGFRVVCYCIGVRLQGLGRFRVQLGFNDILEDWGFGFMIKCSRVLQAVGRANSRIQEVQKLSMKSQELQDKCLGHL